MSLNTIGISHKITNIRLREKVAFVNSALPNDLADAYEHHKISDLVVLSTCNRTELMSHNHDSETLLKWLATNRNIPIELLRKHCYALNGKEAIKHLIEVACGMDSMMFGESEILGQVKVSYRIAKDCGMVDPSLQHIFEQAFKITKLVRTHTYIHKNPISVHSSTVRLMEDAAVPLDKANIVLIGTSDMIQLISARLIERGAHNIHILNRTYSNARALAEQFNVNAAPLKDLKRYLYQAHTVISCTGSAQLVIERPLIEEVMSGRDSSQANQLLLIDLAIPCDIDHTVGDIPLVTYYDIDSLKRIADESKELRQEAARTAHDLINKQLEQYQDNLHIAQNAQLIQNYRQECAQLRDKELSKSLKRLKNNDSPEQVMQDLAHSLTDKLMHEPTVSLRNKPKHKHE